MAKNQLQYVGRVFGGHLPTYTRQQVARALAMFEGKNVRITVEEHRRIRSNRQNAYYWGVVIPIIHEMFTEAGNDVDKDEVHDFLKTHVGKNKVAIKTPDGLAMTIPGTTTKLNTIEFEVYMEKIRAWAAQFNVMIPLPNEELQGDDENPTD